jgi:phage repressor protein C with HTH and peptisase S24 domain
VALRGSTELARSLRITYQAVRKVLLGGQFGAKNNAAAAKRLGVNSDWLATGKGQRRTQTAADAAFATRSPAELSPEQMLLIQDLDDIPPARRSALVDQIHKAAEESREAAAHFAARQGKQQQPAAGESTSPGFALSDEERARVEALRHEATSGKTSSPKRRSG